MNDQEINIAIAEACGTLKNPAPGLYQFPRYTTDLNAMREVEETLLPDDEVYSQRNFYASLLGDITLNDNGRGWTPLSNDDCFPILHATARQRAEAFLRTIGKWKWKEVE